MKPTKIRQTAEMLGGLIAFLPNPEHKAFRQDNVQGLLDIFALSVSKDGEKTWVRGWNVSLYGEDENEAVESRYIDANELRQIEKLVRKTSDASAQIGYEYHSKEGVIFKKFHSEQRITFMTPGWSVQKRGYTGEKVVEEMVAFMHS